MTYNKTEHVIVAESPKVLPREQIMLHVPYAGTRNKGVASFDRDYFIVTDGRVVFKTESIRNFVSNIANSLDAENEKSLKEYSDSNLKTAKNYSDTNLSEAKAHTASTVAFQINTLRNIYVNKTEAEETYVNKSDAEETYVSKTEAEGKYATKTAIGLEYYNKNYINEYFATRADVDRVYARKSDISTVYRLAGSYNNWSDLYWDIDQGNYMPQDGDVVNIIEADNNYPAGTNFVYVDEQWDALGGIVDLSRFLERYDGGFYNEKGRVYGVNNYGNETTYQLRDTAQTEDTLLDTIPTYSARSRSFNVLYDTNENNELVDYEPGEHDAINRVWCERYVSGIVGDLSTILTALNEGGIV